jgi:hypothetical protein
MDNLLNTLKEEVDLILSKTPNLTFHISSLLNYVENFDTEYLVLKHQERSKFETHVDPLLNFLHETLENNDDSKNQSPVSFQQLFSIYIYYLYMREDSSLSIQDLNQ